jgi:cobalt-precorrin-6B (C15)-methyltransferase
MAGDAADLISTMERLPGGPTQEEVMAISLAKLAIRPSDIVADIGCGTGRVAIAASKLAGRVHAIDRREEAIRHAERAAAEAGAGNISFHLGEAAEILPTLGRIDRAFVGGTRQLRGVLTQLAGSGTERIVVNAVRTAALQEAITVMEELRIFEEALLVQVSRTYPIGGGHMFRPIDPIFVIVGGKG